LKFRIIPQSIRGRLLMAALVFTAIALLFAGLSIGHAIDRFVVGGLNERLDAQIALLTRAVRPDGSVDRAMLEEIGPFTQHEHGWRWRIDAPGQMLTSEKLLPLDDLRPGPGPPRGPLERERERPWSEQSPDLFARSLSRQSPAGVIRITTAAPRATVDRLRNEAVTPVLFSLGALGLFLLAATLLQLRIGLRPLARLRTSLAEVRAGRIARIDGEQPVELRDVVGELNDLLDENEAALARARGHVANLAHSLKTPLATLSLKLKHTDRDPDGALSDLVAQIDRAIRHHLGRARAASPGAPGQPQIRVSVAAAELAGALGHIHADRAIRAELTIAPSLQVKCDPQDFDEMLGNLLDNAWKWARTRIAVTGVDKGPSVDIVIDDDGPGLSPTETARALVPGLRLDEQGDGHGFGLPIARELAELHGGSLALHASPFGGLRVILTLPG
jgi:signal transduction histidine kinase